jgi:hypothetical protein
MTALHLNRQYPPIIEPDEKSNSEEYNDDGANDRNRTLVCYGLVVSGDH